MNKNILVVSAPSGSGKSVAINLILSKFKQFQLSISTTTRNKRAGEIDGVHYYFISKENFEQNINDNMFIEYEKFFDNYYGTLKSEVERITSSGNVIIFDIDVKGALSIKKLFPNESLLLFIEPPSIKVLEERLRCRGTETEEQIHIRLKRVTEEMSMKTHFDYVIINDNLEVFLKDIEKFVIDNFSC